MNSMPSAAAAPTRTEHDLLGDREVLVDARRSAIHGCIGRIGP
ncbi:hypothetical protein Lcho_2683 [Leptothrix cholodnii SP-6]|uniref:Uncharacterized protein n=1 Tax=Leptothrix cholodnii (strain ATCC 51168 / LMG 8142 / SP-6) TaxID=395495 RepID=B1Y878_LEPCP|nr:hypothetical protein Lcho_2683 [Leptothrix cholodnii SP-6]